MTRSAASGFFAAVALVGTLGAEPAAAEHPTARLDAGDQAAAKAVLVRREELPNSGWAGGFRTPDLARPAGCAGFRPKEADLVVTGAADALIHHTGIELLMQSRVYKTARMVGLAWKRWAAASRAARCVRAGMTGGLPSPKVVSFAIERLPHVAPRQRWFRLVADVTVSAGVRQRVGYDVLLLGSGRTSINLAMVYVFGTAPDDAHEQLQAKASELALARVMLDRVTA